MSTETPSWLGAAITAAGVILAVGWAFIKRFLSMPSREEFQKAHDSNTELLNDILNRVGKVETDIAYIKGNMSRRESP